MPLEPARLDFAEDGTLWSGRYSDVYHTQAGALEQAHHVFLGGNGLPARWQGRDVFTVIETGFGQGLNFLATWAAWRADPKRCARLHFVSTELHPFTADDLATLHARWPRFAALAQTLHAEWPPLTPGFHRVHLDRGAVTLTLLFGDTAHTLQQLEARADAIFLDGFAPARNPAMWSQAVFDELGRLAAPDATLATWSVSRSVRDGLDQTGFECQKTAGFAHKKEMLQGVRRGTPPARPALGDATSAENTPTAPASAPTPPRHALIIGAGAAGSAIAHRLAERGWTVDVVDANDAPGQGASGNHAGVLRPLPSLDDNRLARLTRAGTLYGLHHLRRLDTTEHPPRWQACGALHLARDEAQLEKQRAVVQALGFPDDVVQFVDRQRASEIAGWPVAIGGWWFARAGWIQPHSLCAANLAAYGGGEESTQAAAPSRDGRATPSRPPEAAESAEVFANFGPSRPAGSIRARFGTRVASLEFTALDQTPGHLKPAEGAPHRWRALDDQGASIAEADIAIIAAGTAIDAFPQAKALPVRPARGQVSHLAAGDVAAPKVVVCRQGYVSPAVDGLHCAGATFDVDDPDPELRAADHRDNLDKLDAMLPGLAATLAETALAGRVGFRPASPDRLPMVGAVPNAAESTPEPGTPLDHVPRHPGLYAITGFGARGLVWSALVAEVLASQLHGEPVPLERDLIAAIDPARYLLKPMRGKRERNND